MSARSAGNEAATLDERHGIPGRASFATMHGGTVAVLTQHGARAVVALQGAQVLSYETDACGEVLWLSPQAQLDTGKAVRGGIPVCWPWFGPHPEGGGRPAHGFVRTLPWRVVQTHAGPSVTRITLGLEPSDMNAALWPHRASLLLVVTVSPGGLAVALTTHNTGTAPLDLTQALHTYLRVGDVGTVTIAGLEGCDFIDQLDPGALGRETQSLRIDKEIDRIYQGLRPAIVVHDAAYGRRIHITSEGSASSVVWNPWIDKSARLGDMGEDGYRRMLCIETANAGGDARTVAPQKVHRLQTTIAASV